MNTEQVIKELKNSNLYAECTCGGQFKLSSAFLFDGTKTFPSQALKIQEELIKQQKEREEELKKSGKRLANKSEHTRSVNVGKQLEKILPMTKDFKWEMPDCKFLGDPIDMITFNGLSRGKINSISFIEVKTGKASLNKRQKSIIDAVEDKKVFYRVIK